MCGADLASSCVGIAKRYNLQIFVSLDLDQLAETVGSGVTKESLMLFVEKSLIKKLDEFLPKGGRN